MVGIMNTIGKTIGRGLFKNQSKQLETEQGTKTQQHPKLMRAIGFGRQRTRLKMKIFVTLAFTENRTSFSCNPSDCLTTTLIHTSIFNKLIIRNGYSNDKMLIFLV